MFFFSDNGWRWVRRIPSCGQVNAKWTRGHCCGQLLYGTEAQCGALDRPPELRDDAPRRDQPSVR